MASKKTLSVAIAVYNEEKNLEACLSSVRSIADEIVVVDGGSTDRTVNIAKKFTDKIIHTSNPPIFHINKQKALDACTGDWILQLDADEVIPDALKREIAETMKNTNVNGFYIPRKNYFWGHWMRKGGQYPDYVIRLIRRGKGKFPSASVHEQIEVDGNIGYLKEPMEHYSYRSDSEYWRKADAYTSLTAAEMKRKGFHASVGTWIEYNILKPKITFFTIFFRHLGFMDGWVGFLFALYSAMHFPIAYRKFVKLLLITLFFLLTALPVRAEYVLPYPSYMPGNTMYKISRILDVIKKYWYFGHIAQIKYHLSLSDKYLVEAKTLFEYKQYLLATDALARSDSLLPDIPKQLTQAEADNENVQALRQTVVDAMETHANVISMLDSQLPKTFIWQPEKTQSTTLEINTMLLSSLQLRRLIETEATLSAATNQIGQ